MAHIKTVGTNGTQDYTTLLAAYNDLNDGDGGAAGGPDSNAVWTNGEDAVLEITSDLSATTNQSLTSGKGSSLTATGALNSLTVRPSSGSGFDGTFGSGRIMSWATVSYQSLIYHNGYPVTFEDFEVQLKGSGNYSPVACFSLWAGSGASLITFKRILMEYDNEGGHSSGDTPFAFRFNANTTSHDSDALNCIAKGFTDDGTTRPAFACSYLGASTVNILNCTAIDNEVGFDNLYSTGTSNIKNCIAIGNSVNDFGATAAWDSSATCISGDSTAGSDVPTTDNVNGKTTAQAQTDLFVSPSTGDYNVKAGSDLINYATDLIATPSGVELDAASYDRNAGGGAWDVGALEYVAAASGLPAGTSSLLGVGL